MSSNLLNHFNENDELDEAFSKINMYLFACENKRVQQLLYKNLEELSKEVIKKDSSMSMKLTQYLISVKLAMKRNK